jgi:hypothetical protein
VWELTDNVVDTVDGDADEDENEDDDGVEEAVEDENEGDDNIHCEGKVRALE